MQRSARSLPFRRTVAIAGAMLIAAACQRPAVPSPARFEGALAFLAGGDTTVVDEYVRTRGELTGTLRLFSREPGGTSAAASYHVQYAEDGRPESARLIIRQTSPTGVASADAREWTATFTASGTVVEVEDTDIRRSTAAAVPGVHPLFGPSIAMLESILLHARLTGVTRLPVFHLAAAGRVDTAGIEWIGSDSVEISIGGSAGSYRLDEDGRILRGSADLDELRTVRVR